MESRFNKYKSENKSAADQIANINNFIDWLYEKGNDVIEAEIKDLQRRVDAGGPAIFSNKINLLIELGQCIERIYETYHFNRGNKVA